VSLARHLFLLLIPVVPWAQMRVDTALGEFRSQEEVLYVWSGEHVKRLAPGFENLMGDIYWLRTVQYFGGQRVFAEGKNFDLLEPLIDITVMLDPRLEIAYRYGAIFLCEPKPVGAGQPEQGVALLERATRQWPESWRLRQELGFFTFLFLHENEKAAQILLEAEKLPGAPMWLGGMAGNIMARAGERQTARQIWRQMYERAEEDSPMRYNARVNVQRLDALDMVDAIAPQVERFEAATGRRPSSLEELRAAGLLAAAAIDPTGVPFDYDPGTGQVRISRASELWKPDL
jgi:hypothetical protein